MATAHLLETSEEDSFLLVARFVGDLLNEGAERTALAETTGSKFVAECEAALAQQRYDHMLKLLTDKIDIILSKVDDGKDLECCINHMCHLISRTPTSPQAASQLAAVLVSKTQPHPEARLMGLAELYNVAEQPSVRLSILLHILRYALATNQADAVAPSLSHLLSSWLDDGPAGTPGSLSTAEQREVLLLAADVYRSSKRKRGGAQEAYALVVRCLDLLTSDASPADIAAVKPAAHAAVLDFIRSPDLFHFDVWESPAVQQLGKDAATADAFALLKVLVVGTVKDFEAFASTPKAAALFTQLGVSVEDVRDKARVMGVAALAASKPHLTFADVQAALGVSEEEVEPTLVRAIGRGLIEGRLDQLEGAVQVTHSASRTFGKAQWEDLRAQLAEWRERLHAMQDSVAAQHVGAAVS